MELKTTKEKVIEAASKCSTAKATLEVLFPEAFENEVELKFGDTFSFLGSKYLLSQVDYGKGALINIETGNRFTTPTAFKNVPNITVDEFNQMLGDEKLNFEQILKTRNK